MKYWIGLLLTLCPAPAWAGEQRSGTVVLASTAFELSAPLAQELAAGKAHALLHVGALPPIDPLIRSGTQVAALCLAPMDFGVVEERAALELLRRTHAVVLSGGTWVDWWRLTHESSKDNALARALVQAHRQGRAFVAIGAAAEYCAQQARLSHAAIQRPMRNPRRADSFLASGLGLVPQLALEVQREAASPALFFAAAHAALPSNAAYLGPELALVLRGAEEPWTVEGQGRGLLLEFEASTRSWAVPLSAPRSARWDARRTWQPFSTSSFQQTDDVWQAVWNSSAGQHGAWKSARSECLQTWNAQEKAWQLRFDQRP